ncbi:hypothetical protein J2Z31_002916 [Sinorhizobium kostiense]|uniref:Uncharacterized protein n=1 Tax=Sinorhizobium kostiense TaxID=76747 RepID=A0ABS4R3F4_9HYPH|nr:hypothetical protein [Sinorhizobium kostiense]
MARLSPIRSFQVSPPAAKVSGERKPNAQTPDGGFAPKLTLENGTLMHS